MRKPDHDNAHEGGNAGTWSASHSSFAWTEELVKTVLLLGFLLALLLYFSLKSEIFATGSNALNILVGASIIGIVSIGQMLTVVSGGFDLSVSGIVPLGSVVYAMAINAGHGLFVALLITLAVGAVCGLSNGAIIAQLNINPLVTTLATMSITGGLALAIADGVTIPFDRIVSGLSAPSILGISNSVWLLAAVAALVFVALRYTTFGRYLYAVGGNQEASVLAGIRVKVVVGAVYVISGLLAALAGAILATQLLAGSGTAGTDAGLQSIAAVILGGAILGGGVGGVPGTLLGVLILGTLANGLQVLNVQTFYQTIATGFVLIIAVGVSQIRYLSRRITTQDD